MYQSKREAGALHCNDLFAFARSFPEHFCPSLRHSFKAASGFGVLCLLITLPITEHGFAMPKGEFSDTLCLRFGLQLACLHYLVCVANHLMLNMLSVVLVVAFQLLTIMNYVTSLLVSLVRFVRYWC